MRSSAIALIAAFSLLLAACGGGTEVSQDAVLITGDDPQYGATLEEWSAAAAEPTLDPRITVEPDGSMTMELSSLDAEPEQGHLNRSTLPEGEGNTTGIPEASEAGFEVIEWPDLVAPGFTAEEVYSRYEDRLLAIEDLGSPEYNAVYDEMTAEYESGAQPNAELDGGTIQLAGFVAPLSFEDELLTEFLLVPYFGACIHVPPPPPHQTILVTLGEGEGLDIDDSYGAVWVTGTLSLSDVTTDLADANYTLTGGITRVYEA